MIQRENLYVNKEEAVNSREKELDTSVEKVWQEKITHYI